MHFLVLLLLAADATVIEGQVPDEGIFFTVPFEVPAGIAEFEIRHDDLSSSNILDWGLFSPDGGYVLVMSGPPLVGGLFAQDQQPGVDAQRGSPRWVPKDRDQVNVVGAWLRADARVSKTWHPSPLDVELFLDVQTISIWSQPTGTSYGTAPATLEQQARGDVTLIQKAAASSPLPPIPVLGVELRL